MKTVPQPEGLLSAAAQRNAGIVPAYRILMVEDDVDILRINAATLVRDGFQVVTAANGLAGWNTLLADRFDLVITDNNMPELTGLDLVKKIRRAHMTLPVILASGSLHTQELERHPWIKLAATLLKPFTNTQLLETVQSVIRYSGGSAFSARRGSYQDWGINE